MMAGTTQDGPTIMRYSEQHYPLLTKFRVGPDPLEAEAKNTKIEPTTSTRQTVMGMILRQVTGDDEGQLSRELVRKWEQKRQLEALPKQVDTWFAAEFMRWLRGVSVFNHEGLTPWGNSNLFHIPEVLAYLREACACRADFQRKLAHLAIFDPRTLNDAYLYYKYIVMHHGWAKAECGPHLANVGAPPSYFTIGGALDFLDDYALTTFQDQALAMQSLAAPVPRLFMPSDGQARPEPNAAPVQQPAPTMPPPPEDPDAHGGGHDDDDDDGDGDDGPEVDTSLTDLTATEAERAAARLEREAQAAAMAIRPVPHNAPPEARVAAAKQHHRTVLDLGQTSRAALAAAEEEERAAAQAERAAQAAQMSTHTRAQTQALIDAMVADLPGPANTVTVESPGGTSSIEGQAGRVAFASPEDDPRLFAIRYLSPGEQGTSTPLGKARAVLESPESSRSPAVAAAAEQLVQLNNNLEQAAHVVELLSRIGVPEAEDRALAAVGRTATQVHAAEVALERALEENEPTQIGSSSSSSAAAAADESFLNEQDSSVTPNVQWAERMNNAVSQQLDEDDRRHGRYIPPDTAPDNPVKEILAHKDAYTHEEVATAENIARLEREVARKDKQRKTFNPKTHTADYISRHLLMTNMITNQAATLRQQLRDNWSSNKRARDFRRIDQRARTAARVPNVSSTSGQSYNGQL